MKPRLYQNEAAAKCALTNRHIIGFKVGLGKTATALWACEMIGSGKVLVICPKSLIPQWQAEVVKVLGNDAGFTFVNYEKFSYPKLAAKYLAQSWDVVICDECHRLSNRKANWTKTIKKLKTTVKIGLTGTPIRERPDQMWSILNWLDRKKFSSYWRFVDTYCSTTDMRLPNRKPFRKPTGVNKASLPILHYETQDYITVKTWDDVGIELPPYQVQNIPLQMEADTAKFYKQLQEEVVIALKEEVKSWDDQLVIRSAGARYMRLRQAASASTVFKNFLSNTKLDYLQQYVEDGGIPALILTRFNHTAEKIKEKLQELGATGYTVGTYGTLAEGHNLQHYSQFIAFDPPQGRQQWEQAMGRIRRLGQDKPQMYRRLILQDTVEESAWRLIDDRQEENDLILSWLRGVMQ